VFRIGGLYIEDRGSSLPQQHLQPRSSHHHPPMPSSSETPAWILRVALRLKITRFPGGGNPLSCRITALAPWILALDSDELLRAFLTLCYLRSSRRSKCQHPSNIVLLERSGAQVTTANIALPVGVLGDIGGGHGEGGRCRRLPGRTRGGGGGGKVGVEKDTGGTVRSTAKAQRIFSQMLTEPTVIF